MSGSAGMQQGESTAARWRRRKLKALRRRREPHAAVSLDDSGALFRNPFRIADLAALDDAALRSRRQRSLLRAMNVPAAPRVCANAGRAPCRTPCSASTRRTTSAGS